RRPGLPVQRGLLLASAGPPRRLRCGAMSLSTLLGIARPHILAIAGMAALTFGWIFSGRHSFVVPIFIMLDWFVVNLANRAVDIDEDLKNGVPGTESVARRKRLVEAACFGVMAFSLGVGHLL